MNQENRIPIRHLHPDKISYLRNQTMHGSFEAEHVSITPKRPLLSRDRLADALIDISPLTDCNFRTQPLKYFSKTTVSTRAENEVFTISPPQIQRSTSIENDENDDCPVFQPRKARPAPASTWKAPPSIPKSSTMPKITADPIVLQPEPIVASTIVSFQPSIRARIPFNLSSSNNIEKQTHAFTHWLNILFTPVEYLPSPTNSTVDQSTTNDELRGKSLKMFAESNQWHTVCDRAREVFARDIQTISSKITADMDIDQCRINPRADLNFQGRTVSRQSILNFISSYNRIWFRLALEIIFPIKIDNHQQMKLAIDQYLIQSTLNTPPSSNEPAKKTNPKLALMTIRLTIKNLLIIVVFLERAKMLRLIDSDPCLYSRDSKFKSTKESLDVFSRDFISSDTNLLRRLKLAGYEPIYRQTSLDEYNYLISMNQETKLFDDLKDGIRLTRCAQILLSSTNEQIARLDLSTRLKCPVVNLVHKLLNIDQAFELFQTYGNVSFNGISNKDIMNGNKQRTLEFLWRIFINCYLPKQLSPIDRLNEEIDALKKNLEKICTRSVEQQLINNDITLLQKQNCESNTFIQVLIKWAQLICAHYKFWLYDLQESFADGRALLFIISHYLPSLCDNNQDIKHLTTLAICQTQEDHLQFNNELGQNQLQMIPIYEKNVKSNFRCLEECVKQFGTFSSDLVKYENYAKDIPDERCTIMILAMLAHDLLFLNHPVHHESVDLSRQDEILITTETPTVEISIERNVPVQLSISSSTVNCQGEHNFPLPIIQADTQQPEQKSTIESIDVEDVEESFNTARSGCTTMFEHRRGSISATMATLSLDDFVELEKTIENEEVKNNSNKMPFFIDETILSETDSVENNKSEEPSFTDPVHSKMLKETIISFLNHQPVIIENVSVHESSEPIRLSENERRQRAATLIQSYWRGHRIRSNNKRNGHPIIDLINRFHSPDSDLGSICTLRERMMQVVREFSEILSSSVTGYLHLLREIKPIVTYSVELRHLIAEQGLLRLFFILLRCCNRSEPSNVLLNDVLNFLQLFTTQVDLTMKLIDKHEQLKDFNMLILKYYQNNGCELFEQICFLLELIVRHDQARKKLRANKSFTDAVEYVYKRLFNKASMDEEKYRQQVRSTPKQPAPTIKRRLTVLSRPSLLNPTPKMVRPSLIINDNTSKKNLASIEKFMKVFYLD